MWMLAQGITGPEVDWMLTILCVSVGLMAGIGLGEWKAKYELESDQKPKPSPPIELYQMPQQQLCQCGSGQVPKYDLEMNGAVTSLCEVCVSQFAGTKA